MSSITDFSSERYQFELSFSFSINVPKPQKWEIDQSVISLYDLMTNSKISDEFINFDKLEKEGYWYVKNKKNIEQFNDIIKSGGKPWKERRENMVASALAYGEKIIFISEKPHDRILEITKLIAVGLAARSHLYTQKSLQEKIKKYILPELEVTLSERKFLVIPCITLWDCRNNPDHLRNRQFVTINLVFLPEKIKTNPFPTDQMYKFINEICQPKLYGNRIHVLNEQTFFDFKIESGDYLLNDFLDKLTHGTCTLFHAEMDKTDYFQNLMMSAICEFSLDNQTCYIPDFSVPREYCEKEKEVCKLLSSFLYSFFWKDADSISKEDADIADFIMKLSQDRILHLPHNVATFFTENRHLTLVVMLQKDSFPDYSSIWTTGSEVLAHELVSTQLYLISYYADKLRKIDDDENIFELSEVRKNKILDFEPFYNTETDDFDLNDRINKMQLRMGIQRKYQAMNQCIESLSTLITEKENENLQMTMTALTLVATILGVLNVLFIWTDNAYLRALSFSSGLALIGIGFIILKRKDLLRLVKASI